MGNSNYPYGRPIYQCITDNLGSGMKDEYNFNPNTGYFGVGAESWHVRIIESSDPLGTALDFFNSIAVGGTCYKVGKGIVIINMADGASIIFRPDSKSGSPAIEINMKNSIYKDKIKTQKIHFELRRKGAKK